MCAAFALHVAARSSAVRLLSGLVISGVCSADDYWPKYGFLGGCSGVRRAWTDDLVSFVRPLRTGISRNMRPSRRATTRDIRSLSGNAVTDVKRCTSSRGQRPTGGGRSREADLLFREGEARRER